MSTSAQNADLARRALERWRSDPVAFAREVLGVEPWHRQAEMLRAAATHQRVAVRAGQKVSKSCTAAILAFWFALCHEEARVILTAPSHRQVKKIIWREIALRREATYRIIEENGVRRRKAGIAPLGGEIHDDPETGIKFPNLSEIVGFSTDKPERMAGISGSHVLFIVDEASGITDDIYEAIEGNTASGARVFAISNPTRTTGWFFEAFSKKSHWHQIHISSEEAAAVTPRIPGLATSEFIAEKRDEWGEGSVPWQVRIAGEFPTSAIDGLFALAEIEAAEKLWTPAPQEDGPLRIGLDPARYGDDDTVIVWSRGKWASVPIALHGLDTIEVADRVIALVRELARKGEKPIVQVDATSVGAGVADVLKRRTDILTLVPVEAAGESPDPTCSRMRDAVWMGLKTWLGSGGAIPKDRKLRDDLLAPRLGYDLKNKWKVEAKHEMRKRLGRSTDRADALALAVYEAPKPRWTPVIVNRGTRG